MRFITVSKHKLNVDKRSLIDKQILHELSLSGITDDSELKIEYLFYTDTKENAEKLNINLKEKQYDTADIKEFDNHWVVSGWTSKMKMDIMTVTSWTIEMCEIGFQHDCEFDGWGTYPNQDPPLDIPEGLPVEEYFDKALEYYYTNDLIKSEAFFSKVIEITPEDAVAYYNRANVKSARGNKVGAIEDFDKAIETDPNYEHAYGNRGVEKDDIGDFDGAIADYCRVIELNAISSIAFLNRGNTYFRKGLKDEACRDWTKSKELGEISAQNLVDTYCK
jgi:tetratricopeptide (TPR) repeat protein